MNTLLLIVHGLLAVALLGAITHQALSVCRRAKGPATGFVEAFAAVSARRYTTAIVVLYVLTSLLGDVVYAPYRIEVRTTLEALNLRVPNGLFEAKEHLAALGLLSLPVYWALWRQPDTAATVAARRWLTVLLAFFVWWSFLVGHILNNIQGFGQGA